MAARLAQEAARSKDTNIAFNRIPKNTLYYKIEEEVKRQRQSDW
jgi:hypothetical protein